jgi:hypothetical protein
LINVDYISFLASKAIPPADLAVGQFDVEAALRRHLVRQLTDKLAATASN